MTYDTLTRFIKKLVPRKIFTFFQPAYHYFLAWLGAFIYRNPSKEIFVVGVTGTKGKTTTCELVSSILEEAGYKTAIASTLRFKIGEASTRNLYKMTMPGRFTIQKFLREAVKANCDYAIIEITSEGAKQFRHKFIDLNSLIFTNIHPEHIEAHGSYEAYVAAKLSIAEQLRISRKQNKTLIVNIDSPEADKFLSTPDVQKITYSLHDAKPLTLESERSDLNIEGERVVTSLAGEFNVYNMLAAITFAKTQNISTKVVKRALENFKGVAGRMEKIIVRNAEGEVVPAPFNVLVDYAHTADSLEAVYKTFKDARKICVLGSCGGGRDKWKRPLMGKIASRYCHSIILTNEDPYDESPQAIIDDMVKGVEGKTANIIMDRRSAIRMALAQAQANDVVLITGKGTDPYIMGPRGAKQPWSDKQVAEEELARLLQNDL